MRILDRADIERVLLSLVRSRLAQLRCVSLMDVAWSNERWPLKLSESLGVSSMELLELASEVSEFFHLHETRLDDSLLLRPQLGEWAQLIHEYAEQQAFSFYTSGSTGEPKLCSHLSVDLMQEIEFFARTIKHKRLISLVPEHHIYGFLWTVLLPKQAGVPVLSGEQAQRTARSQPQPGDLIIATPPVWDFLLRSWGELPAGVRGVSSTAPLSATTARELRAQKLAELYEIYGSSETAAIGYRHGAHADYQMLPYLKPLDEANLEKINTFGMRQCLPLQDYLQFDGSNRFRVAGRRDGLVQVAGHNVCLETVAAKIAQHAAIGRVEVMGRERGGNLTLVADVHSPRSLTASEQADIRQWCRRLLPPHQNPALNFKAASTAAVH